MKSIIEYPPIGKVELSTRRNVRRTTFSVSAQCVKITTSHFFINTLFPLSKERIDWILKTQEKLREKYTPFMLLPTSEIETCFFKIRFYPDSRLSRKNTFAIKKEGIEMKISYFPEFVFEDVENQQIIVRLLKQVLRKEAERFLPIRIKECANKYGFKFDSVRINGALSRWGSCSSQKHINLSCYLMLLPLDLIDFVLVHELCHTEQMNHGVDFKHRMKEIFIDYDLLNKRLKAAAQKTSIFKM